MIESLLIEINERGWTLASLFQSDSGWRASIRVRQTPDAKGYLATAAIWGSTPSAALDNAILAADEDEAESNKPAHFVEGPRPSLEALLKGAMSGRKPVVKRVL